MVIINRRSTCPTASPSAPPAPASARLSVLDRPTHVRVLREALIRGQDTDDVVNRPADEDLRSHDVPLAAVAGTPEVVAENHDVVLLAELVVGEAASESERGAEQRQET